AIADDDRAARRIALEHDAALVGRRLIELADVLRDAPEIDRRERAAIRAGLDSRDPEQRIERRKQRIRLDDAFLEILAARYPFARERFEPGAQPRERAAQIVRDAVADVPEARHQLLDLVEHRVQVLRELVVLVAGAGDRHWLAQVAGDDLAGRAVDLREPALRAEADQEAAEQR